MRKYQIKDLERLTGIKAHTIRIWEKRYNLLNPERSDTNIRYYNDNDLRHLLNISLLLQRGSKISKLSVLNGNEINARVSESLNETNEIEKNIEPFLTGLVISMVEMDEDKFNSIYFKSIHKMGFLNTMTRLVYPFLMKIGIMWGTNEINPAQEHFISNLIRRKMLSAINDLPNEVSQKDEYILYLPQEELHEIGLIFAHYLLKERGYKVYYLGQGVPFIDLEATVNYTQASHVMTIITSIKDSNTIQNLINDSLKSFKNQTLLFSGLTNFSGLQINSSINEINGVDEFVQFLNK